MARKPQQWPLRVKSGLSFVTIYKTAIGGQTRYQLRWEERGKVFRRTLTDEKLAIAEAQTKADQLQAGDFDSITLPPAQAAIYHHALESCGEVPLDVVCREWAEAKRRLGDVHLLQAVDEYITRHQGESVALNRAVDAFIEDSHAKGNSEVYLNRISDRLEKLKAAFGSREIRDITEIEIRRFIDAQGGAPRTRKNVRDGIVTLWRWARKQGHLPRDIKTEAERIEAPQIKRKAKIEIFTPDEIKSILDRARGNIRPVIAICAFAGVRSQGEISRLCWEHFRWKQGVIDVSTVDDEDGDEESVSKTGARRLVPILPNLRCWLADFTEATGPVLDLLRPDKAFARAAKAVDVKWKHNALRHSFGSYRVAATKSVDQTSLEMGNSPAMVRKHYLEAVHEDEAEKWFSVMP